MYDGGLASLVLVHHPIQHKTYPSFSNAAHRTIHTIDMRMTSANLSASVAYQAINQAQSICAGNVQNNWVLRVSTDKRADVLIAELTFWIFHMQALAYVVDSGPRRF